MKIDSVSYAVASKVVKTFAMSVSRIRGYSAADGWLQVFDLKAVPASGTGVIPKRSYPIYTTAAFDIMLADEPLDFLIGCTIAMSSTEGTYTALASTMDLFVTGTSHIDDTDWLTVGDYTINDSVLQVWADADGPKKLVRLEVSDTSSLGPVYVQVHAGDTPATDKIVASFLMSDAGSVDFFFGEGFSPLRIVNGVTYDGCTIAISDSQNTYTAWGADQFPIKATYKS